MTTASPPPLPSLSSLSHCAFDDSSFLSRLNGGSYHGASKDLLPSGIGDYTYSNGSVYRGEFFEGSFHGSGALIYPNGSRFEAKWKNGELVAGSGCFYFADNLPYGAVGQNVDLPELSAEFGLDWRAGSWKYSTPADRRYWSEINNGILVAREIQLTDRVPEPRLPYQCLDVGDGYLVADEAKVYHYNGLFNRDSGDDEIRWAKAKCRIGLNSTIIHKSLDISSIDFIAPVNQNEKKK